MKSFIKDIVYTMARMFGHKSGAVILVYHSIGKNGYRFTVSPEEFDEQMRWLKESGCNVVSLDQLAAYRKAGLIPQRTVCVTFDDGYLDNYTEGFPILQKYGIPATMFITTGDVGQMSGQPHIELKKLSEKELHELHASGLVSIQPHSRSHPQFTTILQEEAQREVSESKSYIEQLLGTTCLHFAYPKGRNNAESRIAAKNAGIEYAYGTLYGLATPDSDDFAMPRNGIDSTITLVQFKGIASVGRLASPFSGN